MNKNWILGSVVAGVGAIALASLYWRQHPAMMPAEPSSIPPQKTGQYNPSLKDGERIAQSVQTECGVTPKSIKEELQREKYYTFYSLEGRVSRLLSGNAYLPVQGAEISAKKSPRYGISGDPITKKEELEDITGSDGTFSLSYVGPFPFPHRICASYEGSTREIEAAPGYFAEIIFDDSLPDIIVEVPPEYAIDIAVLQRQKDARGAYQSRGKVEGNTARFADVEQGKYDLFLSWEGPEGTHLTDMVFIEPGQKGEKRMAYACQDPLYLGGQIKDKNGENIPNASITIGLPGIDPQVFRESEETGERGDWHHLFAPDILHNLAIHAEGYKMKHKEIVPKRYECGIVDITLERGMVVSGEVINKNGEACAGANVYLLDALSMRPLHHAQSDQQGRFIMEGVEQCQEPPFAKASLREMALTATAQGQYHPSPLPITLEKDAKDISLKLIPIGENLEGRVVDEQNQALQAHLHYRRAFLPGTQMPSLSGSPLEIKGMIETQEDGTFHLTLPSGEYDITAITRGRPPDRQMASVPGSVKLVVGEGYPVTFNVLDKDDHPLAGAGLKIESQNNLMIYPVWVNGDGHASIRLQKGKYQYTAWYAQDVRQNNFDVNGNESFLVRFLPKYTLSISAIDKENGVPVKEFEMLFNEMVDPKKAPRMHQRRTLEGSINFIYENAGELFIKAEGYEPFRTTIDSFEDNSLEVRLKKKE